MLVLDADDRLTVFDQLRDARLLLDLHALRRGDREVLEALHLRVRDDHTRELRAAAVRPGTRLAAEARDLGEVEPEAVDEPVDGVGGAAREHADEVVARELLGGPLGVLEEDFCGVLDPEILLRDCAGAVDSRGRLCGVATHETRKGKRVSTEFEDHEENMVGKKIRREERLVQNECIKSKHRGREPEA